MRHFASVYERLTNQSRAVIANAQAAAQAYNHNYVGTEHLLLGLLRTPGVAAKVLQSFGITEKQVDAKVLQIVGCGDPAGPPMPPGAQSPFAPRGKRVLDVSHSEALSLGHEHIDAEHLLLALLRERDGVAARILHECGADYEKLRAEVLRRLSARRARGAVVDPARAAFAESIRVETPPPLRRLLMVAAARALDDGRAEIEALDVLLALTRDETIAPLLKDLRVDEPAIRAALERRRASEEPPEASATA